MTASADNHVTSNNLKTSERRLKWKLDLLILPILTIDYFFAQLDRQGIGNAKLQGLQEDVLDGSSGGGSDKYGTVVSLFFVSYIITQPFAVVLSKYFRMNLYISLNVFLFGLCASLEATTFNFSSLAACRWFLGHFEALFAPPVVYYLTLFYTKSQIATRISFWFGIAAIAGAFSGAIAYGVQTIEHPSIAHFRILFLIEGVPACAFGLLTMALIPNRPNKPSLWLSDSERELIQERVGYTDEQGSVNKAHIIQALTDWKVYWAGAIYFCLNNALASTSVFLPSIVKSIGYSNADAQLYVVPPYVVAAAVTIFVALWSDYIQLRGPFMVIVTAISVAGYAILLGTDDNHAKYAGVFLVVMGVYPSVAMINSWLVGTNLGSESKKTMGMGMFYAIGQVG